MLSNILLKAFAAACLITQAATEPISNHVTLNERASSCTPTAGGSSTVDDVPAIEAAIKACPSGTIVIPSGTTYHINSQLSFTGCVGCRFVLDGELSVSTDFSYWNGKGAVIYLKSIQGATITGSGTINGNGQASCKFSKPFSYLTVSEKRVTLAQASKS